MKDKHARYATGSILANVPLFAATAARGIKTRAITAMSALSGTVVVHVVTARSATRCILRNAVSVQNVRHGMSATVISAEHVSRDIKVLAPSPYHPQNHSYSAAVLGRELLLPLQDHWSLGRRRLRYQILPQHKSKHL
jgi:hypothetical protein